MAKQDARSLDLPHTVNRSLRHALRMTGVRLLSRRVRGVCGRTYLESRGCSTLPSSSSCTATTHRHDGELRAWRRDLDGWRGDVC
jgi:hypothetical protein